MSELVAQLGEWRSAIERVLPPWWTRALAVILIAGGIALPLFFSQTSGFMTATIIAVTYATMALGLNVVVGFAGLLDLGYVAFYALGAYATGWLGSTFFFKAHAHVLVSVAREPDRHPLQLRPDPDLRGVAHLCGRE